IGAAICRQASDHARETCRSPTISAAPEITIFEFLLLIVPDMRKQLLFRIPQASATSLDLRQRFIVVAHRCEERRRAIESVRPQLVAIEYVVESSVSAARRLMPDPRKQPIDRMNYFCVPGPLRCLGVSSAAHCGVRCASTPHDAHPAIWSRSEERRVGKECRSRAIASLQHCLRQD